ncbi:MAG: hypothetical protein ACTSQO_05480 [Candidatus Helarchaeota archaeon]
MIEENFNKKDGIQFKSTRHSLSPTIEYTPSKPRLGRRESVPHSEGIHYLYDVLKTNFPNSTPLPDLHHYFKLGDELIDLIFDVSFFYNWKFSYALSSYKSFDFNNRVPDMAINILSKSTWRRDIGEHVDYCEALKIPVYVVYSPYDVATNLYKPPFLRVYVLKDDIYVHKDCREFTLIEGENKLDLEKIIDLGENLPFRMGLMLRKKKLYGNFELYHLILIDREEDKILPTKFEMEREKAEKERERAEKERERADNLNKLLQKYKEKFGLI